MASAIRHLAGETHIFYQINKYDERRQDGEKSAHGDDRAPEDITEERDRRHQAAPGANRRRLVGGANNRKAEEPMAASGGA